MSKAPTELLNRAWQRLIVRPDGKLDRRFYTFCVLEKFKEGLTRRDLSVSPSERWGDPRAKLLQGSEWEAARAHVCRTLDLSPGAEGKLEALAAQLDEAYRRVAANLPRNADIRIERVNGKDRLSLTGLDKLEEPPNLIKLRDQVDALLPRIDLTDVVLEIHGYTGFADEFTHISEGTARVENLALSICAALVAEACNIGIEPLIDSTHPALTYARLAWVEQNYIRAETLIRANARLVDAQSRIPLAQVFGGGEVASAIGESRFWRINPTANYGALNGLARQRINLGLIHQNWDDLLRVVGSLKMGKISASELIRMLQRGAKRSTLAKAIGELGRIPKTLHLLTYIDDPNYRRRILTQLNRGEGHHRLARKCFHGQRGELRQRYREGQEDQLSALGLVVNALVLWNTRYMDAALNYLRSKRMFPL
jgi:hypothetical protein